MVPVRNFGSDASPGKESVKMMREFVELSRICCFGLLFLEKHHIVWYRSQSNQCLFFRQRHFDDGEMCGI